jgi:hypothetical protein
MEDAMAVSTMSAPARRWQDPVVAGVLLALAGMSHAASGGATLDVVATTDGYLTAPTRFPDLQALGALVDPASPGLLRLAACGTEAAGALLAAAEQFRSHPQELQLLSPDDARCRRSADAPTIRSDQLRLTGPGPVLRGAAYWRDVAP